ncbi:hypothetical protein SNE40_012045 [Patella caerulea]|uniref:Uncharacterized protein n=1 Tax=Patella caerulea TaxID=87958 RepID=A0AAN8PMM3_PATCE
MELAALCSILDENPNDEDDILLGLALGGFFDDRLEDDASHIDHRRFNRFNLDNFSEAECKYFFRFQKDDIPRLDDCVMPF